MSPVTALARRARCAPALTLAPLLLAASCRPGDAERGAGRATAAIATADRVQWGPAEPLGVGASTPGAAAAFAVLPGAGRVSAGWVDAPAQGRDAHLVVRADLGAAAVDTVRDVEGGLTVYGETPPKLAYAPDGTLYVAYLVTKAARGHKWPVNTLRLASSHDGGRTWDAPRTVQSDAANGGSTDDHALTVAPDGALVLTWLAMTGQGKEAASHTYLARSPDGGRTWSAPRVVDAGPSCPCCRTAVAAGPDGALYAAWRKIFPAPAGGSARAPSDAEPREVRDIAVARSADGGRTWGAPVRVHADEWQVNYCPDAGPSVRVGTDGVVHVAWWTGKDGAAGVRYARSTDGARSFGAPVPLGVGARSRAAHVQLAVAGRGDAATVVAVWEDGTRQAAPLVARVSRDGGRSFGPADVLSAPGVQVGYPVVALETAGGGAGSATGVPTVRVAWQQRPTADGVRDSAQMAAAMAASDAAEHHHGAMPDASQWIQPVGAWQVLTRVGTLHATARTAAASNTGAFRPLAVGDQAPAYAAPLVAGPAGTGAPMATARVGGPGPVTLLNVWATWCTACREEMDDLAALHRDFAPRGLRVLAVSVDAGGDARVRRFASDARLPFAVAHDPDGRVQEQFGVVGVPASYLVDAAGRVRWAYTGNLHGQLGAVRAAIDSALAAAPKSAPGA